MSSYDFEFLNTVPWKRRFAFTLNGSTVPLPVGTKMHMQLRIDPASDDIAIDLSTDNGRLVIVDPPNGVWAFNVSASEAEQVTALPYKYDLTIYPPSGDKYSIVGGSFLVDQGVTRDFDT